MLIPFIRFRDHVPIGAGFSTPIDHQGCVVRPNNQTKVFWSAKPQVVEQLWFVEFTVYLVYRKYLFVVFCQGCETSPFRHGLKQKELASGSCCESCRHSKCPCAMS